MDDPTPAATPHHCDVRTADPGDPADLAAAGRLLHDFNVEYDDPTPAPAELALRLGELVRTGDTVVLLGRLDGAAADPVAVAVLRFRPALWSAGLECYLAELYVVPHRRGEGLGRAMLEAAIVLARARGADSMDLGTGEDDLAARALYASLGFSHRDGGPDGPVNYYYELDLAEPHRTA